MPRQSGTCTDIPRHRIGSSANFLTTMLTGNGVPNDVISNFNSLSIILLGPCLNVSSLHSIFSAKTIADTRNCSTACTLPSARRASTTVPLPVSLLGSSSVLWPASDTAFFATKHTRPTLAACTVALIPLALTMVSSRPSRSGGLRFHLPSVVSPSCLSTCLVSQSGPLMLAYKNQC